MHVQPCSVYRVVILHMRSRRIRYPIIFVAAMFLANNVATAARVSIAGPQGQDMATAHKPGATGVEHGAFVADDAAACVRHCAQPYKDPAQKLATNVSKVVFISFRFVPNRSVEIAPTASVIALAPQAIGPPLTVLFGNLRN